MIFIEARLPRLARDTLSQARRQERQGSNRRTHVLVIGPVQEAADQPGTFQTANERTRISAVPPVYSPLCLTATFMSGNQVVPLNGLTVW